MGAGGLASPFFVNAVNVITYVIMIIMSPFMAVLGNRYSQKWILVFGTIGFLPYFGALYCNSTFGTQWFLILGGVTCGFSAAALWTAEAAMAIAYPEHNNRGTYIAIWMAIGMTGSVIGSSIQLALNVGNANQGSVSGSTYLAMIGLSCLGLPLSLTVAKPEQLRRSDGTVPTFKSGRSSIPLKEGLSGLWKMYRSKHILMLFPIFVTVRWSYTYQSNYLALYFTVGGRALAGFIQVFFGIAATMLWGFLLDSQKMVKSRRTRAALGWYIMLLVFVVQWAMNFYLQATFSNQSPPPVIGISSPGYAKAITAYCLFRCAHRMAHMPIRNS
jgi:MFS family permease